MAGASRPFSLIANASKFSVGNIGDLIRCVFCGRLDVAHSFLGCTLGFLRGTLNCHFVGTNRMSHTLLHFSNSSIVGPSEGIPIRFLDRTNEHEIELVAVIGKQGSNIPKDKAKDFIAGYTLGLDMTCRGGEDRSFRKSIDGYSVLGPWFVTADEIANPDDLKITLTNNGEVKQIAETRT